MDWAQAHLYNVIKEDISLPEAFPLTREYVWLAIVHPDHRHGDCDSYDHHHYNHPALMTLQLIIK